MVCECLDVQLTCVFLVKRDQSMMQSLDNVSFWYIEKDVRVQALGSKGKQSSDQARLDFL